MGLFFININADTLTGTLNRYNFNKFYFLLDIISKVEVN